MSFTNSSRVGIHGSNTLHHVNGIQVNGAITAHTVTLNNQVKPESTKYDEYENVKHGHVIKLKELWSDDLSSLDCTDYRNGRLVGRLRAQKTISTVKIYPDRQSRFTVIMYEGKDAGCAWEEDFERFSRIRKSDSWQLYGLNYSTVPLLIFHGELVPLAHFYKNSFWGDVFIGHLSYQKGYHHSNIWLNTRGGLCDGPDGPYVPVGRLGTTSAIPVPSTVELLENDVSFRFFRQFPSTTLDLCVLDCAYWHDCITAIDDVFMRMSGEYRALLDVLGALRFDSIYSSSLVAIARFPRHGGTLWRWNCMEGLANPALLGEELTRFELDLTKEPCLCTQFHWETLWSGWLSQFPWVADVFETVGKEHEYLIVNPPDPEFKFISRSRQCRSLAESPIRTNIRPIYLFLYPLPRSISELISWEKNYTRTHYWSLDENGQSEMLEEECERFGVPKLTISFRFSPTLRSWPAYIHTALRNWQVARGFDPTTSDFAQSLGFPQFEITIAKRDRYSSEVTQEIVTQLEVTEDSEWEVISRRRR